MTDNNVFQLAHPGTFTDSLTEILRNGARTLLTQAVEAEVAGFLTKRRAVAFPSIFSPHGKETVGIAWLLLA